MTHVTHISFFHKNQEPDDDIPAVTVEGFVPNVTVGMAFVYDHPQMRRSITDGKVSNIQHAVDIDGKVTTYIDVTYDNRMF